MNILITNDDGISSPGLRALAVALSGVGNVLIAAPDRQRSGAGTSNTLAAGNLPFEEVAFEVSGVPAFAVGGTPCDCVSWGLRKMRPARPDLLVSGINIGANLGLDILYSGTVMATLTGYYLGIPCLAMSQAYHRPGEEMRFEAAARMAVALARDLGQGLMKTGTVLNVNVPNIPLEQIKGARVTRPARVWYTSLLSSGGNRPDSGDANAARLERARSEEGTDVWAVNEGYVAVTPLRFEVTHHDMIPEVAQYVESLDRQFAAKSEIAP